MTTKKAPKARTLEAATRWMVKRDEVHLADVERFTMDIVSSVTDTATGPGWLSEAFDPARKIALKARKRDGAQGEAGRKTYGRLAHGKTVVTQVVRRVRKLGPSSHKGTKAVTEAWDGLTGSEWKKAQAIFLKVQKGETTYSNVYAWARFGGTPEAPKADPAKVSKTRSKATPPTATETEGTTPRADDSETVKALVEATRGIVDATREAFDKLRPGTSAGVLALLTNATEAIRRAEKEKAEKA